MIPNKSVKKYGWFSPKQKKVDEIVRSRSNSIYWEKPDRTIVEVTIVNTNKNDSGTNFNDMKLVGEVTKYFGSYS